jgi:KUP system potassium uptake protein
MVLCMDKTDGGAKRKGAAAMALAALGVVYGDIGTSPLYTIKTIFDPATGVPLNPGNVVGAISVVFWTLMVVVTLKYVTLVMRADNRGEGGVMALLALASRAVADRPRLRARLLVLGAFGACLFYGDSVLTPAISVLSAVEGLEIATPALKPWIMPLALGILIGLFAIQNRGTAAIGRFFGPAIVTWFGALAAVGIYQIAQAPEILVALDPRHAWRFLSERGWGLFLAVGAILLAITGAEALYADMGHFGARPIRLAWTTFVLPSLAINYAGQGALLLRTPAAASNPFYLSFPDPLLLPAVALATAATIIASQAVISGAFSLTQQAIQLGFLPRMKIVHTSAKERGQIYLPAVNWLLLASVVYACFFFGTSSAMASAYGIAVTGTMLVTTLLTYFVVRQGWGYPAWVAVAATAFFVAIDVLLLTSASIKIMEGGWFPVALAVILLILMLTWKRGRELLARSRQGDALPLAEFAASLSSQQCARSERTAVFLSAAPGATPSALLHNLKHNMVLHERNIVLSVSFLEEPFAAPGERLSIREIAPGFWEGEARFGFMERPDLPAALELARAQGLDVDPFATSYFLSRETVAPGGSTRIARWRQALFEAMSRNSGRAVEFFELPSNSVIELGARVQL